MPNTDANGALEAAEKVRKVLEATSHPIIGNFTASVGVAERNMEENYKNLYNRVDQALYQAKKSGRNCVIVAENIKSNYAAVLFKWNQKWNCGEVTIDEQHRELFRLVSQLANNSGMESEKENTIKHINDIINHVTIHFEYEENALIQVGYENIWNHKKIHVRLLERANEIKNAVEIEELDYIKAFSYIFDEIIIGHILDEDAKFYSCFQHKQI